MVLRFCAALCATLALTSTARAQVVRVSVSTAGAEGNNVSYLPALSVDGRFVVFVSWASNLVGDDTNSAADVFLRDRDTDGDGAFDEPGAVATTRINVSTSGGQTTGLVRDPAISATGRLPDVTNASPPPPPAPVVLQLLPNSRTTVPVTVGGRYGVLVESSGASPVQIVVESASYRNASGVTWAAGSNAMATPLP